ncbi:hypothetical protein J421_4628 (plasmid) [Gemmatirosa kalamazoonensis]|uniref:Phage recombination protein Bet n=1 Tax=Gemmatirosa kalamazoonensis TaxID=861299 RepID=W0RRF0_9BACT|nr:phage recombination protein Bet [Gemmatirosa kalamazoonensis]AHG92095.1 hypothetical protein J421_4560 [Gemmatirosa kalamazoonensis]AHG92163.1 hypothetical protein J421_4628 [Gemmatirosa kalamazoonensis]
MTAPAPEVQDRAQTGPVVDLPQAAPLVHVSKGAEREQQAPESEPAPPTVEGLHFTREQIELIKRTIAKGATDDELQLFLFTCKRLRLDPFARQIYFIKRKTQEDGRWVETGRAEVSIDGFRLVAERTGEYEGQTPPQWGKLYDFDVTGGDPVVRWFEVWPFPAEQPYAARVGVHRRAFKEPLLGIARFDAYAQKRRDGGLVSMWERMGPEQLAKCAEALALRKAFPNELSGVYTPDEMGQASNAAPASEDTAAAASASAGDPNEPPAPTCPKCSGGMWDNRETKTNPRAPDFKCKDRSCDGKYWPGEWPPKSADVKRGEKKFPKNFPLEQLRGRQVGDCTWSELTDALEASRKGGSEKWIEIVSEELEARRARGDVPAYAKQQDLGVQEPPKPSTAARVDMPAGGRVEDALERRAAKADDDIPF